MALLPWFRALHIAATVLVGGAFAFELLILRRCGEAVLDATAAATIRRWSARLCAWSMAIALVSWIGWLAATAMGMSGLPLAQAATPQVIGTVLARTVFGHVWCIRLALLVLLAALLRRQAASALVALALVASLAWTGHALGTNRLHVWVDAMHLIAATAWLGMLPLLGLVMMRAAGQPDAWGRLAVACAKSFFLPGVVAVAVLAASGVANTSWMIDSVADLWRTDYGRILALKLGLFALMVVLACRNHFAIVPRAERAAGAPAPLRTLRTSVITELGLGAAVLAVVAWLGVTPPAAHPHMAHQHRMQDTR